MNGADLAHLAAASPFRHIRGRDVMAAVEERDAKQKHAASSSADFEPFSPCGARSPRRSRSAAGRSRPSSSTAGSRRPQSIRRVAALTRRIEQSTGGKPTLTDFLLFALAQSLFAHPRILDRWHEEDGRVGRMRASSVDIGIVVALSDGVMIPGLRDLAGKSIDEVSRRGRTRVSARPLGPAAAGRSGAGFLLAFQHRRERRRPLRSDHLSRPIGHSRCRTQARAGHRAGRRDRRRERRQSHAFPGSPPDRRTFLAHNSSRRWPSGSNVGHGRPADQIYPYRFASAPSLRA